MVIVLLTIVVVGPEDIPKMMRYLGRQYGKIMRASEELRRAFMVEADRADAEARAEELKKRREIAKKRAEEMRAKALASRDAEVEAPVPRGTDLLTDPPPTPEALVALATATGMTAPPPAEAPADPPPVEKDLAEGSGA